MYELIRREMIDGRREMRTQCIMLQERGAPWSAKAGANDSVTDSLERCLMERCWAESGLSKRVSVPRVPCWCGFHERPGREGPMHRIVKKFSRFT